MMTDHRGASRESSSSSASASSSSSVVVWMTVLAACTATSLATAFVSKWYLCKEEERLRQMLQDDWKERRNEERLGRIRAEVKLRTLLKEQEQERHRTVLRQQQQQQQRKNKNKNRSSKYRSSMDGEKEDGDCSSLSGDEENDEDEVDNSDVDDDVTPKIKTSARRDLSPETDSNHSDCNNNNNNKNINNKNKNSTPMQTPKTMLLTAIGYVVSPYTKRMGTPRQSLLVPSSRGYIDFAPTLRATATSLVSGIEEYSHVWILFEFHANTNIVVDENSNHNKTKIRPPRAPYKMGQLATRSPHRPNPLGLSLVKVERYDAASKRLYVSGLDLVCGTPVYDMKPSVPWDMPGYYESTTITATTSMTTIRNSSNSTNGISNKNVFTDGNGSKNAADDGTLWIRSTLRVPDWVSQRDEFSVVEWTDEAQDALRHCVELGHMAPLYTLQNNGYEAARQTLSEILALDPRSSHKGLKENARGSTMNHSITTPTTAISTANNNNNNNKQVTTNSSMKPYSLVFCQASVEFVVLPNDKIQDDNDKNDNNTAAATVASKVLVTNCSPIQFSPEQYVDGIPLISEAVVRR